MTLVGTVIQKDVGVQAVSEHDRFPSDYQVPATGY
jgi:hypothetical protein